MTPRWIAGHGYVDSTLSEAWKRMGYRCCRDPRVPAPMFAVHRPDGTIAASERSARNAWDAAITSDERYGHVTVMRGVIGARDYLDGVYEAALDELERDPSIGWERALERAKGNL